MIGCVGIGGVVLVPAMTVGIGIPLGNAIAAALMGYVFTGISGTLIFGRSGSIDRRLALDLCYGAAPGALLGAWASQSVNPHIIEAAIAALAIVSGLYNLRDKHVVGAKPLDPGAMGRLAVGALVGLLSAMTGTGGPLILVPLLLSVGYPVLTAVGLGQAFQIPVAVLATAGTYAMGSLDLHLGAVLSIGLVAGSLIGAKIAHKAPRRALRLIVAGILVSTGAVVLSRLISFM